MSTFHPAFAPLHAHMCGMEAGMAHVGAHRLAALYPVEVASYTPFLIDFYAANRNIDAATIRDSGSGFSMMSVAMVILPGYSSGTFFTAHPLYTDAHINADVDPLVLGLNSLLKPQKARIALRRQLTTLMKAQYLLSHWDGEAASRMKPALRKGFEAKVKELSGFFGAKDASATCAPSAQLVGS